MHVVREISVMSSLIFLNLWVSVQSVVGHFIDMCMDTENLKWDRTYMMMTFGEMSFTQT